MLYRLAILTLLLLLAISAITAPAAVSASRAMLSQTYTVQPGDTLTSIAARFGLPSWQVLYDANRDRVSDPHALRVGQVLAIPDMAVENGSDRPVVAYLPMMAASTPPRAAATPSTTEAPPPPVAPSAESRAAVAERRQDMAPVPAAAPARLTIPAIGLDTAPVPVGLDRANLPIVPKHDVGWYTGSAMPHQGDNIVFWGHVSRWRATPTIAAPFERVPELSPGAEVVVETADGQTHRYVVTQAVQVRPHEVQYILPTGTEQITLVTCIGDRVILNGTRTREKRLIVIAEPASP